MCLNMGGIETDSLSDGNVLGIGGMLVSPDWSLHSVLSSTESYEFVR